MKEVLKTKIRDWRLGQNANYPETASDVPETDKQEYELRVSIDESTGQLYIDVDDGNYKGLSAIIEINEGRPCIHLANDLGGDNLLHAFALNKGIVVTPDTDEPLQADNDRYSYNTDTGLLYLGYEDEA